MTPKKSPLIFFPDCLQCHWGVGAEKDSHHPEDPMGLFTARTQTQGLAHGPVSPVFSSFHHFALFLFALFS